MGLELKNVSKSWRGFELKNIEIEVETGDYFIILGPTGAGKTLLLETIMGFHTPDKGKIFLDGTDITEEPPERRNIGYVSQKCVLFPHMNVRQNVEFGLKMRGTGKTEREKTVNYVLEFMGLKPQEHRLPATLSGGEKQKVALARVLATKPQTIIFDEPLTGIDAETARELKNELKRIHRTGKTIIHVTHNQIEGFSLGNKMTVMNSGEIVQTGAPKELFVKPLNKFMARFLGYENIFDAKLVEKKGSLSLVTVEGIKVKISETVDTPECVIAVRPEDISISFSPIENDTDNILKGTVIEFADQGPTVSITVDAMLTFNVIMTKSAFVEWNLETGQEVWLTFKSGSVKVIKKER
jgi:ABC-type Fe3+/spermidine/putrescine transport system ATPase subunit